MSRAAIILCLSRAAFICVALVVFSGCPKQTVEQQPVRKGDGNFQPGIGQAIEQANREKPAVSTNAPGLESSEPELESKATASAERSKTEFADWPQPAAVIVATGQLLGYIEPCGC